MKSPLTSVVLILLGVGLFKAQNILLKGEVKLVEFTNESATFTVPNGKIWYINSILISYSFAGFHSDKSYSVDGTIVRIRSINNKELTDLSKNRFGPKIDNVDKPFILPEHTVISFIILEGEDYKKMKISQRSAFINYVEIDK